ncbi:protein rad9 [Lentinula guzmanii]|uniref:Sister chromatid cohesion protein n=1 Tax=Lentinula guzmanii TaxID=2804957 RepID=A0AA38JP55_9AGAR|nr:protein rad9 [Lentinula guzmanii]
MANNDHNRSVRDSHRLLASYPTSSAAPSGHVARHLDNLSITAAPPSFVNQHYYNPALYSNTAAYPEYTNEIGYLSSNQVSGSHGIINRDGGYWERARDQAVALLNEQAGGSYPYAPPPQWTTPHTTFPNSPSSFQTPSMAHAVFSNGYPTPPTLPSIPHPPPSYTSSLAGALGPMVFSQNHHHHHHPQPPQAPHQDSHLSTPVVPPQPPTYPQYAPTESASFFDDVLSKKLLGDPVHQPVTQSHTLQKHGHLSSPKKRKIDMFVEVPSPNKKVNLGNTDISSHSVSRTPSTPSKLGRKSATSSSIFPKTPSSTHSLASSVPMTPSTTGLLTPESRRASSVLGTNSLKRKTLTLDSIESLPASQKPFITPTTGGRIKKANLHHTGSSDVELEDEEDELNLTSSPLKPLFYDSAKKLKPKVGRDGHLTHDREERSPLEKLVLLIQEVFAAEDGLPADPVAIDLAQGAIFNPESQDPAKPQLSASIIRKLTKYFGQVRGTRGAGKGVHSSPTKGRVGRTGKLNDIGSDVLGRLLRILARSLKIGGDVDPFGVLSSTRGELSSNTHKTPKKKKGGTPAGRDDQDAADNDGKNEVSDAEGGSDTQGAHLKEPKTPKKDKGKGKASTVYPIQPPTAADFDVLIQKLTQSRDGVLAAESVIALLGGESGKNSRGGEMLSKQLYSEEIILECFNVVKSALEGEIFPFVEGCSGVGSGLLMYLVNGASSSSAVQVKSNSTKADTSSSNTQPPSAKIETSRSILGEIFAALSATLPRISTLVGGVGSSRGLPMSDAVVIKAVYVGIGPFFVTPDEGLHAVKQEREWEEDGRGKAKVKAKSRKIQGGGILSATFGKSAMRGLRMDALSLIRSIFAHHDDQRSWIIEEILSSLINVSNSKQVKSADQFRLRDGHSMRTISALLLQLVQSSAHDIRLGAQKLDRERQAKIALRRQESIIVESQQSQDNNGDFVEFLDEDDRAAIKLHHSALASPHKAASTIIQFLTTRSGKSKTTKNSNEAEYRAIFDALVQDCLSVWCWPEWPSAGIVLSVAVKGILRSLEDENKEKKSIHSEKEKDLSGDNNIGKSMALDHLGAIATRVRTIVTKVHALDKGSQQTSTALSTRGGEGASTKTKPLKTLNQIVEQLDCTELERYLDAHWDVAAHLCKRAAEDQAYDSAQELNAAALGQDLAAALQKVVQWIEDESINRGHREATDDVHDYKSQTRALTEDHPKIKVFGEKLKYALKEVWKERGIDLFDIGSSEEVLRVDQLAEEIGVIQGNSLRNGFIPMLNVILQALDAPVIFMRTKALRALGQIITSDPSILTMSSVRQGIEGHLLDSSAAVRDAAVELIGRYMIDSPDVAADYYPKIADRIADTGLSVRKRVIKLLKAFYHACDSMERQTDISTKLVLRMMDEDDTVKDLAMKAIEELWFPLPASSMSTPGSKNSKANISAAPISSQWSSDSLQNKVAVIMSVSANFRDRQSPLEELLHNIMSAKVEGSTEAQALHARYAEICEVLIDGLVDASDLPGFTVVNCIRTINLIVSAYPAVIGTQSALTLLPYLKNPTNAEEQITSDYLLRTFRTAIPHMLKTAVKFGQDLQAKLQPMVTKPSAVGGITTLQEVVACLCAVVQCLTHDFARLVALLKSCNARIQQIITRPDSTLTQNDSRALGTLIFIVSLLVESCNFDKIRSEQPSTANDLNAIATHSITEHIYNSLLQLHQRFTDASFRARVLPCLGFLFRAQPTLMTLDQSTMIMDNVFASDDPDAKARMLKIIQEFLVSESVKHSQQEKERKQLAEVNMDELVGNTDGFADSGVSSAIVQRYLDPILGAAISQNTHIQASAIDILTFTVKQGLAHPLQSFPFIVALETSPSISLSNRATALHAVLHNKHASLLNSRFILSARKSFEYQRQIDPGNIHGYRMQPSPLAVLQRWYSLVRERRAQRQDFLKALVKVFYDLTDNTSQDDVEFTRYMAENFAAFDYKTQEEVLTVIKSLTTVLSTTGLHVLEVLSPSHLLLEFHSSSSTVPSAVTEPTLGARDDQTQLPIIRMSVIVGMVMILKAYLKTLYSLSEDKCTKFNSAKKSVIGDKSALRRHDKPITWDRLPFAMKPIITLVDVEEQKQCFKEIWSEDGVTAEPENEIS